MTNQIYNEERTEAELSPYRVLIRTNLPLKDSEVVQQIHAKEQFWGGGEGETRFD